MLSVDWMAGLEFQRKAQQGLGRPIVSWTKNGMRYVTVGGKVLSSQTWGTFHDFLKDYVVEVFGKDWFDLELSRSNSNMHPLVEWYCGVCEAYRKLPISGKKVVAIDAIGIIKAYLFFSYHLYLVSHNADLLQSFVNRLKNKDQFHGAYYELFVAAQFIKSGFMINHENENDVSISHVEFVAVHEKSRRPYSVEAKARHIKGYLGACSGQGENLCGNVKKQLKKALSKNAMHDRIVFVDANFRDVVSESCGLEKLREVSRVLREDEDSIAIDGKPAPKAYVFVTNFPYHFELQKLDYHCSAILVGFKIKDFNIDSEFHSLSEALRSRDKHQDMLDLMECMRNQAVPSTFDGENPEFIFGESDLPRLMIGRKYVIPGEDGHDVVGELTNACVSENEQQMLGIYRLDSGQHIIASCPLSDLELRAYKMHPDTFFGVVNPVTSRIKDGIDLFDFFYGTYKEATKEKLLEFMSSWPDLETLQEMSQEDLARIYCTRLAVSESNKL